MDTPILHRGYTREDGLVFWVKLPHKDVWLTPEKFISYSEKCKAWRRANPKYWEPRPGATKRKRASALLPKKSKEERLSMKRAFYHKNRDRLKEDSRVRNAKNREHLKLKEKERYLRNPGVKLANNAKRRAARKLLTPENVCHKIIKSIYSQAARVTKCTKISHSVDHIVPLAVGGKHHQNNLQVLPLSLNSKKNSNLQYRLPDCYIMPGLPLAAEGQLGDRYGK